MREARFYIGLITLTTTYYSCQKPIDIKATTTNANILVVEGLINAGTDSTKIKLSRTVIIGNKTTANPEGGAAVSIENAQATVATLKEIVKGTYATPPLNLDKTNQYRLRVRLANGKTYLSDLVETKVTPPIDSVGYTIKSDGIQLYLNSHDVTNNSRYYIYNYTEAWKFESKYVSALISDGTSILTRTTAQNITSCFGNSTSANIILNSTAALNQDVTYQTPITNIDATSEKISIRYSILVTQTALTKEAYAFWENLKKSTEQLGSIFDAQPSQLIGNIHNIADASEPVIGYINAATTQSKRIFIDKFDLPPNFRTVYPYNCSADTALFKDVPNTILPLKSGLIILAPALHPITGTQIGYTFTSPLCGDCTVRGTKKQPIFWK
jgi:hypothetical protein